MKPASPTPAEPAQTSLKKLNRHWLVIRGGEIVSIHYTRRQAERALEGAS